MPPRRGARWTYAEVEAQANRIAHVLVDDMGLVPGNRVLLRGANSPMLAACWLAVVKAGGIVVGSMPLLRAKELAQIIDKAEVSHALCDVRLGEEHLLGRGRGAVKDSLGNERSGVPSMAWGIIERCYDASLAYVRERKQFGRAIGEFQAVQLKITDLFLKLRTVENIVFRLAWMQQNGVKDLPYINASKAMSAQLAVDAALTSIQIHGGYGYMEELGLEKLARDAKLLELGAGTTDINLLAAARELIGVTE